MTAEREAMTLKQARDLLRNGGPWVFTWVNGHGYTFDDIADAIDARLSRAAEPWCCCGHPETPNTAHRVDGPCYTHPPEPARDAKCNWTQDVDGNWGTDCGNLHILIDGTPYDNEMGFCCYCGHAIDQVLYHDAAMSQESGE